MFDDSMIDEVLEIARGRKIIYINDVRRDPSDKEVYKDLVDQQKWGIMMSAEFMLLKFNSQAPETTWVPGARCARSGTNGQAVVRSLQNFHERFRRC